MHRRSRRNRGLPGQKSDIDARVLADYEALARFIVEWCEGTESRSRPDCVRTRRCRGPGVPCFDVDTEDLYVLLAESPAGKRLFQIAVEAAWDEDDDYDDREDVDDGPAG